MAPVASSAASSSSSPPPPDNSGTFLQFDVVMQHQQEPQQQEEGEEQRRYQMKMRPGEETTITIPTTSNNSTGYNSSSYSTSSSSTSSSVSSPSPFTSGFAAFGGASAAPAEFSLSASELLASMSPLSSANDAPLSVFMESYKTRLQQDQQVEAKLQLVSQQSQSPPVKPEPPTTLRKSVSPKRERDTSTSSTTAVDASSSSQHEEDALSSDSSTTKKVFKCTFPGCGKEFQLKGNLKRHQNIHNGDKKFRCKFCGKDFLRKADMEVHHRVHTGEKPYKCKFADCDKCFARRSDLLSHERTHVGTKPFACLYPGCERHFARKFDLQKHQRMHDNHSSECQKRRKISSPSSDDCNCWPADPPPSPMMDESASAADQASSTVAALAPAAAAPLASTTVSSVPRYQQLTCTQDHIHSPPACFAAFTPDLLDNFLLSSREIFDSKPYPGCCDSLAVGGGETAAVHSHAHHHNHHSHNHARPSIKQQFEALVIGDDVTTTKPEFPTEASQSTPSIQQPATSSSSTSAIAAAKRPRSASASSSSSSTNSCPMDAELLKDYAKHTPSCGHLSILHGNHRDYVVKNHLVCQDSVRSIGGGENHSVKPAKCPVDEPHRPGCGHLPVRHRDHIDYVVEDNLFCQQAAGMLDAGADNIELLDDDFWEFYGAIGSLNTD